jgi:transcriptional regulator of heat shock response
MNKPANTECQELYLTLRGGAISWCDSLKQSGIDKMDWANLKNEFVRDYDYRISDELSYRLTMLKQKMGESIVTFFARVSQAIEDIYNGMPDKTTQKEARQRTILHTHKNIFRSGLRKNLRAALQNQAILTLKDAKEEAQKTECLQGAERANKSTSGMWEEVSAIMDTILKVEDRDVG